MKASGQLKLNDNENKIYQYILDHIEEIPKISCRELARRTYNYPTTILRMIKKMGYENYADFKVGFILEMKNKKVDDYTISKNENDISLVSRMASLSIDIIKKMQNDLNTLS